MRKKLIVVVCFILLFCFGVCLFFLWFHTISNKIFISPGNKLQENYIQKQLTNKKPIDIVLLGYGGGNHDGAYLTDSIMVVHIDPATQKVFLVSIPRDIWIQIPTDGKINSYWKINAAYELGLDDADYPNKKTQFKGSDGGGHMAEYVISQVTGLPIQNFIGMDFSGFKHTIDTLGGVDITVETAFTDSEYPIDGNETNLCGHQQSDISQLDQQAASTSPEFVYPCRYENLRFDAGLQHMNGERALSYVRSRHSLQDGTDFGRAKRQRNLLVAVKQKIFSANFIPQIIPFISSLGDDFRTDLSLGDVKAFLTNANTINKYHVETLALTDQNYLINTTSDDGQAILEPKDGLGIWTSIHNFISEAISGKKQPVSAIVRVENGTDIPGLAGLAVNRLTDQKIQTLPPTNYDLQTYQKTTITVFSTNIEQQQLNQLKQEFGVQNVTVSKDLQQSYNVLVVVGEDYNVKQGVKVINEP